jgi:hypothetical protein
MTLKLNDQQLEALFYYFQHNVISETPDNDLETIAQELLCDIFLKMDRKLKTPFRHSSNLTLTHKECRAFSWHFKNYWVEEGWLYETNVARKLMAQIDPKLFV